VDPALAATLWVALGGALGSVARYWMAVGVGRLAGEAFPWGTLLINVLGSFVITFFGSLSLEDGLIAAGPNARLFVMVGLCGGFTTFSSFSLQTLSLAQGGQFARSALYVVLSVGVCVLAAGAGFAGGLALNILWRS
jgi:fluoride exporter